MSQVVPTILARTPAEFIARLEQVTPFAKRIHVDIADGTLTAEQTINLAQVHCPDGIELDLHLMVREPKNHLENAIALRPSLVIIHAESDGDHHQIFTELQSVGIRGGVALVAGTQIHDVESLLQVADHALVFTGTLGENRGHFNAAQLTKLSELMVLKPSIETSVDGGLTMQNIIQAKTADVCYVGSAIADASNAAAAYDELSKLVGGSA